MSTPSNSAQNEPKLSDFEPPQASIAKILKNTLPENVTISKEAKAAFAKAAGMFIFYTTFCANEFCKENKRSTLALGDVTYAIRELGFSDYLTAVNEFHESNKEKHKRTKGDKKVAEGEDGAAAKAEENDEEEPNEE